jgi:hypothetical protein
MEEMRNAYRILVGEPEGKLATGRSRRRCENIRSVRRIFGKYNVKKRNVLKRLIQGQIAGLCV